MKKRAHYILTRYNLGLYRTCAKRPGAAAEWMQNRIKVFSERCVPSIGAQTAKNFKWVIVYDSRTDQKDVDAIEKELSGIPHVLIRCQWPDIKFKEAEAAVEDWTRVFRDMASNECKQAIMTRLDNDDAICKTFIENVQNEINKYGSGEMIFDFKRGIMHDPRTGECWIAEHAPGSPFVTLVENCSPRMGTVYQTSHYSLTKRYDVCVSNITKPMWQMVIHGSNKTNRIFEHMKVCAVNYDEIKKEFCE